MQFERMLGVEEALYLHRYSIEDSKKTLSRWEQSSACEKLAMAEGLLEAMMSEDEGNRHDYKWQPGNDDLSLPSGRAKWALERLLRVNLPGVVDRKFPYEELKKLHARAVGLVEAYRQDIMASNKDREVSPAEFARLKRQFKGKIDPGSPDDRKSTMMMDRLFAEWPPIGRKYEDLISILGVKGERKDYGVDYKFQGAHSGTWYCLVLKNGVIWSVQKRGLD